MCANVPPCQSWALSSVRSAWRLRHGWDCDTDFYACCIPLPMPPRRTPELRWESEIETKSISSHLLDITQSLERVQISTRWACEECVKGSNALVPRLLIVPHSDQSGQVRVSNRFDCDMVWWCLQPKSVPINIQWNKWTKWKTGSLKITRGNLNLVCVCKTAMFTLNRLMRSYLVRSS